LLSQDGTVEHTVDKGAVKMLISVRKKKTLVLRPYCFPEKK